MHVRLDFFETNYQIFLNGAYSLFKLFNYQVIKAGILLVLDISRCLPNLSENDSDYHQRVK
jgi:hypothetical protein